MSQNAENVLFSNVEDKHAGKYVITDGYTSDVIVCYGDDHLEAFQNAERLGVQDPVVTYVQKPNEVFILSAIAG